MNSRIAFIGLGNMGSRMASRLISAGYDVTVFDLNEEAVKAMTSLGAHAGSGPDDAAAAADVVLTSLTTPEVVERVYRGPGGVLDGAKAGVIAVDFSTIDPATAVRISTACADRGLGFLDGPVSRGVAGAESGTLSIMIGGDSSHLDAVRPVLEVLGSTITHIGRSGSGQLVKLCNNMTAAIITVALGEVLVAGVRAGLSTDILYDVLHSSSADNHILAAYFPRIVFPPERPVAFSLDFMVKDIELFLRAMGDSEVPMFLSGITRQIFRICQDRGLGGHDSMAVVEFYEQLAGVRLQMEAPTS